MALVWSDLVYSTGLAQIDAQHQELFKQINALLEKSVLEESAEDIKKLLEFLGNYVLTHFKYEEEIMEQQTCSKRYANVIAHRKFIKDFKALKSRFEKEGASPAFIVDTQSLLVKWLSNHIIKIDCALRDTCASKPPQTLNYSVQPTQSANPQ